MELTLIFGAAVVVAFLAGWKGIGVATKAKASYTSSRALADAKKLVAKHNAEIAAYNAAVALIAAQPVPVTGTTGGIPAFLVSGAAGAPTGLGTVTPAVASGVVNPTHAG